MGILARTADALSGKAATSEAVIGRRDERPNPWSQDRPGAHQIGNAAQHAKAYGGGKDGVDYFYEAANVLATAASTADWHLENDQGQKAYLRKPQDAGDEVVDMPADLKTLFTLPNPWMTWGELLELMIIDYLAVGNGFWAKQGADDDGNKPLALYRLPPAPVEVVPGKRALIDHYKFGQGKDTMKVPAQQMVHVRLPNPHSEHALLGAGVIQAAPQVFDVELGLVEAQRNFFANGTVLSGTMESDKTIPEATRKKSLLEFRRMQKGSTNWFNVAFLERGLKYRPIQANAQQADYRNLSLMSRERIFAMLRTPMILAGIAVAESNGMKVDEARRFYAEEVAGPHLTKLATAFSLTITNGYGWDFVFDYGYKMPEADRVELALNYADLPGITVGEVREKAGLKALPDDLIDERTGEPVSETVLNLPGDSTEGPGGTPDNLGTGRPADRENVEAFPTGRQAPRDDEGQAATRARRQRAGTRAGVARRRTAAKALFTPDELASGDVFKLIEQRAHGDAR